MVTASDVEADAFCNRRCPRRITFATEFSGLDAPAMAIANMSIKADQLFATDSMECCRRVSKDYHHKKQVFDDIRSRDVDSLPPVHYYHYSPPCTTFSPEGKRAGASSPIGRLWKPSVKYIIKKKPRLISYEMVPGILKKPHKPELKKMISTLKRAGYTCHLKVLNTRQHGIAQRRRRLYMVGALAWRRPFTWPAPVPVKWTAQRIVVKSADDDGHRLPPKSTQKNMIRQRTLVKRAYKRLLKDGINPATCITFTDIGCSLKRATHASGEMPCVTARRGQCLDYWISTCGRRITLHELGQFQGLTPDTIDALVGLGIRPRKVGEMLGNALSLNVIERVLGRALWSAGLVGQLPEDRWS